MLIAGTLFSVNHGNVCNRHTEKAACISRNEANGNMSSCSMHGATVEVCHETILVSLSLREGQRNRNK